MFYLFDYRQIGGFFIALKYKNQSKIEMNILASYGRQDMFIMFIIKVRKEMRKMKKYLLELPEEVHAKLKIKAVKEGVTMNDLILGSIKKKVKLDDASELIVRAYNFVKNGPNPYLEEDLKEYCESMSLITR